MTKSMDKAFVIKLTKWALPANHDIQTLAGLYVSGNDQHIFRECSLFKTSLFIEPGTPKQAASFPGDLTTNHGHPYYLIPGTSTEIILNHPSASANMTDSCARDTMTSCDTPGQSLSPTTLAASADLPNLLPPHIRSQTHAGIILCLLAQQTRAKTSNSQPIRKKQPPKNLDSSRQMTDSRALKPEARSGGIEGEKTVKRRRVGSNRAIPCENSVGNSIPLQSNMLVEPKELTRDETLRMLIDKARTKITRYLGD